MNIITILSIWGALLSTVLAVIRYVEIRRDRSDVKVTVKGGYIVVPVEHPGNPYGSNSLILITAVNSGRRPVYLQKAGILGKRRKGYLLLSDSVTTIELKEKQSKQYQMLEEEIKESNLSENDYVAFVVDSMGKTYYSHSWLKRLYKLHRVK